MYRLLHQGTDVQAYIFTLLINLNLNILCVLYHKHLSATETTS